MLTYSLQMANECSPQYSKQIAPMVAQHCVGHARCLLSPQCDVADGNGKCSLQAGMPSFPHEYRDKIKYFKIAVACESR